MLRVTLRWTNIPSRKGGGFRNTPSRFVLQQLGRSWGGTRDKPKNVCVGGQYLSLMSDLARTPLI